MNIYIYKESKKVWRLKLYQDRNEQWMKWSFSSKYELRSKSIETEQNKNEQWTRYFSSKQELSLKSIEIEAVLTKIEMNDERNVHFSLKYKVFSKKSVKLYFPLEKRSI